MTSDGDRRVTLLASVWTLLESAEETPTAEVDAALAHEALDHLSPATNWMRHGQQ